MKDEAGPGQKNRQRLFLGMGAVAKRLIGRLAATAHEGSLLHNHAPIGKLDAHMPADTQRATLDYSHDHFGFYRYKGFFHSCSFFSFLLTKQPMTPFCLFQRPGQTTTEGAEKLPRPRFITSSITARLEQYYFYVGFCFADAHFTFASQPAQGGINFFFFQLSCFFQTFYSQFTRLMQSIPNLACP